MQPRSEPIFTCIKINAMKIEKFKTQKIELFVPSTRHQNCLDKSLHMKCTPHQLYKAFFNRYLAVPNITAFVQVRPEGHQKPRASSSRIYCHWFNHVLGVFSKWNTHSNISQRVMFHSLVNIWIVNFNLQLLQNN